MQLLANGIVSGLALAMLAVAFGVVYVPTRVFHLVLGGVYALVPFVLLAFLREGFSWIVSGGVAVLTGVGLSLAVEHFVHFPLDVRQANPNAHLIAALGAYAIIVQSTVMIWGERMRYLPTKAGALLWFRYFSLTRGQFACGIATAAFLLIFVAWFNIAPSGLHLRALSDNPEEYGLRGHSIRAARLLAFGISGLMCAVVSILAANDLGFDPQGGLRMALLAIVAFIVGGCDSILGAVLGGMILGILRSAVAWWAGSRWEDAATFMLLALFLILRPQGLLGHISRLEVQ